MKDEKTEHNILNYVLLGSFLGGLVGTTVALMVLASDEEELKEEVKELQREFLEPVRDRFTALIDNFGEAFKQAMSDAYEKAGTLPEDGSGE
ncbi:MAG: hypothetical protein JSV21_10255 [Nitrospirota bacterium]|nr:MAG: hypothetical protein JSV21_10255 [Nitrospirota bacterium]